MLKAISCITWLSLAGRVRGKCCLLHFCVQHGPFFILFFTIMMHYFHKQKMTNKVICTVKRKISVLIFIVVLLRFVRT